MKDYVSTINFAGCIFITQIVFITVTFLSVADAVPRHSQALFLTVMKCLVHFGLSPLARLGDVGRLVAWPSIYALLFHLPQTVPITTRERVHCVIGLLLI